MRISAVPLLLVVCVAAGCRDETRQPAPSTAATATAAAAPRDGGRLVRRLESNVGTLNYVLHTTDDERQVLSYIYDPLIDLDRNLEPIPGLAARWEVLDGGRTYLLHLDPRANFSDGVPLRASDVIFTINKILDEDSMQFAEGFAGLDREQTRAVDERTVRITFRQPRADLLYRLNLGVMPEHVYATSEFQKITEVIGTGPYVLKRRERDRSILLERRDDYWRTKPHIQSVVFRPITENAVAWKAVMRGDVDVSRIDNDLWARVKDDPDVQRKIEFHSTYQFQYNAFVWNLADPLLSDARVRRALAMSFDRRSVIQNLYHGEARPVTGPFTPDHWANNPEVTPIELNAEAAAGLLSAAGWQDSDGDGIRDRNGQPFALTLLIPAGSDAMSKQSQIFQESLRRHGIRVEISALEGAAFFDRVLNRNYQAAMLAWVNDPEPNPHALFHSSQTPPHGLNVVGYANAEADQLMEQARLELDRERREDLYQQLHEVLARDQPYLWTVQVALKWAVNRRVQNVQVARGLGLFLWYPGPYAWWLRE